MDPKNQALLKAILELPRDDRVEITNELKATMDSEENVRAKDKLAAELDRRFEEFQRDPTTMILWSELRDEE